MRIEHANLLKHYIDWYCRHHRRKDPLRDHPEQNVGIAKLRGWHASRRPDDDEGQSQASGGGNAPVHPGERHRQNRPRHTEDEQSDRDEPRAKLQAAQRISRHRAGTDRENARKHGHDHRVEIGPESVAAQIDEYVPPGVQRRRVVDERQIDRPVRHMDRQLHRCDDQPVKGKQHDEGPQAEQPVDDELRGGRHAAEPCWFEQLHARSLRIGWTMRLKKATQRMVDTNNSE